MESYLVDHPTHEDRKRRVFIDPDAAEFTPRSEADPFASVPENCVAFWDFKEVDGKLDICYATVRPDRRNSGLMTELLDEAKGFAGDREINPGSVLIESFRKVVEEKLGFETTDA